jgi:hypothetical protein
MPESPTARANHFPALLAAGATILGAVIASATGYLATRAADHDREQLAARAAARLVDSELGEIAADVQMLRDPSLSSVSFVSKVATSLPTSAWTANRRQLATSLGAREWDAVDRAYLVVRRIPASYISTAKLGDPGLSAFHRKLAGDIVRTLNDARSGLRQYE